MKISRLIRIGAFLFLTLLLSPVSFAQQCSPAGPPFQPEDSLVMNTVVTGSGFVKTVKVEKEVFLCDDRRIVKDVNIFTEIIEDISSGEPIEKKFEAVTCLKDVSNPRIVACETQVPPGLPPELPPCQLGRPPGHPLEMNTVTFQDRVKTVKTEKEVFQCGRFIVDLNIFTEIIEDLPGGDTVKRFEIAMCAKDTQGNVVGCQFF